VVYEQWAVVVVPFPFTDRAATRRRPALVVSRPEALGNRVGQSVLAMITSAVHRAWPLDTPVRDLAAAGLPAPSVVRMKLFTLDDRLVHRQIGALSSDDASTVAVSLDQLILSNRPEAVR
jgi:mRNA interferase MazF